MIDLRLAWRDVDRLPYLYVLRHIALGNGLNLELIRAPGSDYVNLLIDGEVQILAENYWNLQIEHAKGLPLVSIGAAVTDINEQVLAGPGIQTLDDLRGKRVAIRAQHPTDYIDRLWLSQFGSDAGISVHLVSDADSGRWQQWKSVLAGECDAAVTTNLFADAGKQAGLTSLAMGAFGFLGNIVFTTSREIRVSREAELKVLLRSAFGTVDCFCTSPDEVRAVWNDIPTEEARAFGDDRNYEPALILIRDELASRPFPSHDAISNFHKMLLPEHPDLSSYDPFSMWDSTLVDEIDAEIAR